MVDRRKKVHRDFADRLPEERTSVVAEAIPNLAVIEQMAQHRAPVPEFAPRSPATAAYEALWARLRSCLDDSTPAGGRGGLARGRSGAPPPAGRHRKLRAR